MESEITDEVLTKLLAKVEETLILDTYPYIDFIDDVYKDIFAPPKEGLYLPSGVEPLFYPDRHYTDSKGKWIPYLEILEYNGKIYEDGVEKSRKLILSKTKKSVLTYEPTLPVNQIKLAYATLQDYLDGVVQPYRCKDPKVRRSLYDIIKEEHHALIETGDIYSVFNDMIVKVDKFVGKDRWMLYTHELKSSTIVLYKGIDFRVYDWYRIQLERNARSE